MQSWEFLFSTIIAVRLEQSTSHMTEKSYETGDKNQEPECNTAKNLVEKQSAQKWWGNANQQIGGGGGGGDD